QKDIGMYPDGSIPVPGNFKNLHPFKFDDLNIRDETLAPWPRTTVDIQASLADYYAMITHLDRQVGDIIKMLKKENLFENTVIVYAADNGLAIGSHGLLGKQNLYEHSMKVPFVIAGPGNPNNEVSPAFIYIFHHFPTLATLRRLPLPPQDDGMNHRAVVNRD